MVDLFTLFLLNSAVRSHLFFSEMAASTSRILRGDDSDFEKRLVTLHDKEFNSVEIESNHSSDFEQEPDKFRRKRKNLSLLVAVVIMVLVRAVMLLRSVDVQTGILAKTQLLLLDDYIFGVKIIVSNATVFNKFIENCQKPISLGSTVIVEEMLVPYRGHCRFIVYMPKKPAKYGLKVMCMTDARTHYLYNAYIYCRRGSDSFTLTNEEKRLKIPTQAVVRLVKPIERSRRNVTADNWFGSIELVQELLNRELTFVGTLKKNKPQIPKSFLPHKSRKEKTSLYGFTDEMSLLSYVPKKGKAVILVSSMHHSQHDDPESGKPEIISFYNLTKGGVDALDQKCATYTASRRTRRWSMAIFFALVDIVCGVNSYCLYQAFEKTPDITRLDFMKSLAKSLTYPHMRCRLEVKSIPRELSFSIHRILQIPDDVQIEAPQDTFEKRKTCAFCPPKLKRKTKYPCQDCGRAICLECARKICKVCFDKRNK